MSERIALACLDCNFAELVSTPESQVELLTLIEKYKLCPECGAAKICQTAWRDENGNIGPRS